ncbi:MAG: hypothetical protein JXA18_13500 [Chitinispirillaceae bacterium]|nr:hypothetical protein [Chitinispirillaceae bacterium]
MDTGKVRRRYYFLPVETEGKGKMTEQLDGPRVAEINRRIDNLRGYL